MGSSRGPWARLGSALHLSRLSYLAGCVLLVATIRLGLVLFSYATLRRLAHRCQTSSAASPQDRPELVRRVRWGVAKAARLVPDASCLTQALAVQFLLGCGGQRAEVHIGVTKGDDGRLCAHAWVTSCGRLVIGGPLAELERYTRLTGAGLSGS